jgi:hypothetical protein
MDQGSIEILLLGENADRPSYFSRWVENHGYHCWFARSTEDGLALLGRHAFRLILSTRPMRQTNPMVSQVGGSDCSVFYCYPVEDGCWWLPLMRHGQKCLGTPALRPCEFVNVLDQVVNEIELDHATVATGPQEVPV